MDEKEIKIQLISLIEDFKANYQKYKKFLEADVETKLIEELFIKILGWTKSDFTKQAKARRGENLGEADYAFKIGDRIVFFLEVKRVGVPLDKEADRQVISYALSKRIPFAVSTNFERLKIFCVEQENAINQVFSYFASPDEYLSKFHDLIFLSKESFEKDLLLKRAAEEGRLKKRISIDKPLLEDLMLIRKIISDDLESEDVGINPEDITLEEIKHFPDNKAYSRLKEIFVRYNDVYNSGLFKPNFDNDCDIIRLNGGIIKKLIYLLYESRNGDFIYNFDWIDADVLGQVYEQYLGKILAQTKSGRAKLSDGQAHRKEQGIYYTPNYIVDYIVKNTVWEALKNKKIDPKSIKILDPACGSGSFLIKAFDYLYKDLNTNDYARQQKLDSQGAYSIKTEILKKNIYGVDLDNKAVEITKLNLLLKAAEKDRKLPEEIDLHIRHGNSLIDDESIVGLDAFKWTNEFNEGSFNIVIGNPPYVNIYLLSKNENEVKYYQNIFFSAYKKFDLYVLFIEKAIKSLNNGGYFSFIIPDKFLSQPYGKNIRKFILENCVIVKIVDLTQYKIFEQATVDNVIIVLKKETSLKKRNNNKVKIIKPKVDPSVNKKILEEVKEISQNIFLTTEEYLFRLDVNTDTIKLKEKIENNSIFINDICYVNWGARSGNIKEFVIKEKANSLCKPMLDGRDINRYSINFDNKYLIYDIKRLYNPMFKELFENPKLMIRDINAKEGLKATYDEQNYYAEHTLSICMPFYQLQGIQRRGLNISEKQLEISKKFDLKYLLAILNSKLITFYFKQFIGSGLHVYPDNIRALPIKNKTLVEQRPLINLVDKILNMTMRFSSLKDKKTSETTKLEREIKETDEKIDKLVYEIYGITKEEQKIIEESLK